MHYCISYPQKWYCAATKAEKKNKMNALKCVIIRYKYLNFTFSLSLFWGFVAVFHGLFHRRNANILSGFFHSIHPFIRSFFWFHLFSRIQTPNISDTHFIMHILMWDTKCCRNCVFFVCPRIRGTVFDMSYAPFSVTEMNNLVCILNLQHSVTAKLKSSAEIRHKNPMRESNKCFRICIRICTYTL